MGFAKEGEVLMGGWAYNLLKDHVGWRAAFMINLFAMLFLTLGFLRCQVIATIPTWVKLRYFFVAGKPPQLLLKLN